MKREALIVLVLFVVGCSRENTATSPEPAATSAETLTPVASAPKVPSPEPAASGSSQKAPVNPIGDAKMSDDGTIVMDLYKPAHARFVYRPSDPKYQEILKHLGGLKPGQSKLVPPWPDNIDDARVEKSVHEYIQDKKGWAASAYRMSITGTDAKGNVAVRVFSPDAGTGVALRLDPKSYEVQSEVPIH